jgi:hypothetical protein
MNSMVSKIHQGVHILHGNQINTAAITAIAAIWTTHGDVFFTPEANSAIAAITRFYANFRLINKSHNLHAATLKKPTDKNKKSPAMKDGALFKAAGLSYTNPAYITVNYIAAISFMQQQY